MRFLSYLSVFSTVFIASSTFASITTTVVEPSVIGNVHLLGSQITPEQYIKGLTSQHNPQEISNFFSKRLRSVISKEERGAIIDVVDQLRLPLSYDVKNKQDLELYKDYLNRKARTNENEIVSFVNNGILRGASRVVKSNMLDDDNRKRQIFGAVVQTGFLTTEEEQKLKADMNAKTAEVRQAQWERVKKEQEEALLKQAVEKTYEANRQELNSLLNERITKGELNYSCQMHNIAQVYRQSDGDEFKGFYPDFKIGKFLVTQRKSATNDKVITVPSLSEIQAKLKENGDFYNEWLEHNQFVIQVNDEVVFEKMIKGNQFIKSQKLKNLQQQSVNDLAIFSTFLDGTDKSNFIQAAEVLVKFNSTVCSY